MSTDGSSKIRAIHQKEIESNPQRRLKFRNSESVRCWNRSATSSQVADGQVVADCPVGSRFPRSLFSHSNSCFLIRERVLCNQLVPYRPRKKQLGDSEISSSTVVSSSFRLQVLAEIVRISCRYFSIKVVQPLRGRRWFLGRNQGCAAQRRPLANGCNACGVIAPSDARLDLLTGKP
jgi:hypothetical protein